MFGVFVICDRFSELPVFDGLKHDLMFWLLCVSCSTFMLEYFFDYLETQLI